MKVFYRIIYALVVAILLFYVHRQANEKTANKYFEVEGTKAFSDDNPDKYRFFYSPLGYHKKEPTYAITKSGFKIQFFEVNRVFVNRKKDVKADEYFYIIIENENYPLLKEFPQRYWFRFINEEEKLAYKIYQFRDFPFSVVVDEEEKSLIDAAKIIAGNYQEIEIILFEDDEEEILVKSELEVSSEDLIIKNEVLKGYQEEEYLNSKGIYFVEEINHSSYLYIYYLIMAAYLVGVIITTYLLFFFIPKKMGRKKPSPHFNK